MVPLETYVATEDGIVEGDPRQLRIIVNGKLARIGHTHIAQGDHVEINRVVKKSFGFRRVFTDRTEMLCTLILVAGLLLSLCYHLHTLDRRGRRH